MIIYIIYHNTYVLKTNIFTTNKDKIDEIINKLCLETDTKEDEWNIRKIYEEENFDADMNY